MLALALVASLVHATPAGDEFLEQYARTRKFMAGRPASPRALPDGKGVLFLRSGAEDAQQRLYLFDVLSAQARELVSPEELLGGAAQELSKEERARLERQRVSARGFTSFALSDDGQKLLLTLSGKLYLLELSSRRATLLRTGEGAVIDPHFSPDGRQVAYVRQHDLYVLDLSANKEHRVTHGGTEAVSNGEAEFVAQEEMDRSRGFWWSPDSRQLAFEQADNRNVERLAIVDPLHPEAGANEFFYPRAGRTNATVRLGIVAARGGPVRWVGWDAARFPYLARASWAKGGPLTLLVQSRAQTEQALLAVDVARGTTRVLLAESDPAWLNLERARGLAAAHFPHWLEAERGFLWLHEAEEGWQVERRNSDGSLASVWLPPSTGFLELVGLDERRGWLYFVGSQGPTATALFRAREGQAPERLDVATEPSTVSAAISRDGTLALVRTSSLSQMPRTLLFSLGEGAKPLAELPSVALEPSVRLSAQLLQVGELGTWALVVRPHRAPSAKRLPVIVSVYGGPGYLTVTRTLREHLLSQWLADQGYLVVSFDGRGTPRRGRAWERYVKGDFSRTVDDQAAALLALAKQLPELDLSRVGAYGWSFGGYLAALSVMARPDVFKAAVAGAPVVDWADYDTHYTERFLGLPSDNPEGYARSSLLTWAPKLTRPLLLVHGTADDNVYFFHTLKLSDALFRAGRPHELLPLSNFTHMVPEPLATVRLEQRVAEFFARSL